MNRHSKKGYGEVGESGRGSSAASGDVDIILDLRRPEGNHPPNRRLLEGVGRYAETPDKVLIQLVEEEGQPEHYELLGTENAVSLREAKDFILITLTETQKDMDANQLVAASEDEHGHHTQSEASIRRSLKALVREGLIAQKGEGKARHPFVYSITKPHVGHEKVNKNHVNLLGQCWRCKGYEETDHLTMVNAKWVHAEDCTKAEVVA